MTPPENQFQRGDEHERTTVSKRKQRVSRCARIIAQRRTRACRQSKICGRKTPQSSSRWAVEGGLRLPMGQRWESREEREILRAVCGQKHPAALFIHVRSE